ncbi:MAG: DUF503 family protein [Pseudomonadales bacterium]|nr:DUF503 family protein [Pseudomonadales bacterium]
MNIACLTIVFHLHGCQSLKDKRQRLAGLRDRFGKQTQVAVCESADIEKYVTSSVDAEVVDIRVQWLS